MSRLLRVKGTTGGRNCDVLGDNNCHLAISPPFQSELSGRAIIGRDRIVELGSFTGPRVDLEYALREVQRFRRVSVDTSIAVDPVTPGMRLADFFLPVRLSFSSDCDWHSIEWTELAKAIRFFDPAAPIYVDRGVITALPPVVRKSIISRGFGWSKSVRDSSVAVAESEGFAEAELASLRRTVAFDVTQQAPHDYGFGFYLALLALRRQFGGVIRHRLVSGEDRDCSDSEVEAVAEEYGGIGARRLVEHARVNWDAPWFYAPDEQLLYGTIYAVLEGADVVFLTRDPLFMEQFAKLMMLLRSDYVASEFGRRHAQDPTAIPEFDSKDASDESIRLGRFRPTQLHSGWDAEILPKDPYLVNVQCWLIGRDDGGSVRFSALTYCTERGMHNLLRVKGSTLVRNIEVSADINIRAALGSTCGESAILSLWQDRLIPIGTYQFPRDERLDLRIPAIPAADITRAYSHESLGVPWYEE